MLLCPLPATFCTLNAELLNKHYVLLALLGVRRLFLIIWTFGFAKEGESAALPHHAACMDMAQMGLGFRKGVCYRAKMSNMISQRPSCMSIDTAIQKYTLT